jgi:hypothetical protein
MPVMSGVDAEVDTRRFAIASIEVYDEMEGDPYVTDHGSGVYDILAKSHRFGQFSSPGRFGLPYLEFVPDIGLTCRPFLRPTDTRKADWTSSTSTGLPWDERQPTTGYYRVYRMMQQEGTPGATYKATSTWNHPEDPHFAFSLITEDTPSDWPTTPNTEPYVQLDLGVVGSGTNPMGQWAIRQDKQGTRLLFNYGGVWVSVTELSSGQQGGVDLDEQWFFVRCLRDSICISSDFGKSYDIFKFPDASPTGIRPGKMRIHGRGGKIAFGIHELEYVAGSYTSQQFNTYISRLTGSTTWGHRSDTPTGTAISITDLSNHSQAYMKYRVKLTPTKTWTPAFEFHKCPVYYATRGTFPVSATIATQASSTPLDAYLIGVDVNKPVNLEESSATVTLSIDAWESEVLNENWRWRKVKIHLGHRTWEGENEYPFFYVGYIQDVKPKLDEEFGEKVVTITVGNRAMQFRRTKWWPTDVIPLGGLTLNQALDYILYTEGVPLNSSYREWHPLGDTIPLPLGTPEEPFELIQPDETKWETMKRLASYMQLELAVGDDGVLRSLPEGWISPTLDKSYTIRYDEDKRNTIKEIENGVDFTESCTAIMVWAEDEETGASIMAWAIDVEAENEVSSGRSCPWREGVQEKLDKPCLPWVAIQRAQSLAMKHFPLKYMPDIVTPVDLSLTRRMRVEVNDAEGLNIPSGTQYILLSMRHSYRARESFTSLETNAGLQRYYGDPQPLIPD